MYTVEKECIHTLDDHIAIKHWVFKCEWLYAIKQGFISFFPLLILKSIANVLCKYSHAIFSKKYSCVKNKGKIKLNIQLTLRQDHKAIYGVQYNLNIKIKLVMLN